MLKIGVFARLSGVSVKTLRFYDEVGLLRPSQVDAASGYRLYALEQMPRLKRILALKALGLSLEQIKELLYRELSPGAMRVLLERKRDELRQSLREDAERLARIEARLNELDQEGQMSDYDVSVKDLPLILSDLENRIKAQYEVVVNPLAPQLVASLHVTIPTWEDTPTVLGQGFNELIAYVEEHGGQLAGPAFDVWHQGAQSTDMKVEVALPLLKPIPASEHIKVYEMPGLAQAASALHRGSFDKLPGAFSSLARWISANNYRISGPFREIYLQYDVNGHPGQWLTEVIYPVEAADVASAAE